MRPHRLLVALVAFGALVVSLPVYQAAPIAALPAGAAWTAALVVPATVALLAVSWVKPEFAWPVVGVFVIAGVAATIPVWEFLVDVGVGQTTGAGELLVQLAVPAIVLAAVVTMARRAA